MLFNSAVFVGFFLIYLVLHALCPARWRVGLVIAGSAVFYGYWNWSYTALPFILAVAAFVATFLVLQRSPG